MKLSRPSQDQGRRLGPSEIALIVAATLTAALVAFTLLYTPTPPVSAALAPASLPTTQPFSTPSASATTTPKQLVAFLGDSYAAGIGASRSARRWATLVSLDQGWTERNLSEAGTGYSTAGDRGGKLYPDRIGAVVATGAQIVVVSGGRMDLGVGTARLRAAVRATFKGIHAGLPEAQIIVVSPTWDDSNAPAGMTDLTAVVKAEAKRANATYLDVGEPMLGRADMVTSDGVFPNDAGHAAIAAAVVKALA